MYHGEYLRIQSRRDTPKDKTENIMIVCGTEVHGNAGCLRVLGDTPKRPTHTRTQTAPTPPGIGIWYRVGGDGGDVPTNR